MTSKTDADPYELKRFVDAQSAVYAKVTEELSAGRKRSHWMWFIFPQIAGLGFSATAQRFAIGTKGEAAAYQRSGDARHLADARERAAATVNMTVIPQKFACVNRPTMRTVRRASDPKHEKAAND